MRRVEVARLDHPQVIKDPHPGSGAGSPSPRRFGVQRRYPRSYRGGGSRQDESGRRPGGALMGHRGTGALGPGACAGMVRPTRGAGSCRGGERASRRLRQWYGSRPPALCTPHRGPDGYHPTCFKSGDPAYGPITATGLASRSVRTRFPMGRSRSALTSLRWPSAVLYPGGPMS